MSNFDLDAIPDQDIILEFMLEPESYSTFKEVSSALNISKVQLLDILGKLEKQEIIDLVISVMSEEG